MRFARLATFTSVLASGVVLAGGVLHAFDTPTTAEKPQVVTPEGRILQFDPDWTPRPQIGDVPAYVTETDVDWVDDRLRRMDTGRTYNGTFRYQHGDKLLPCFKGTAIRVGDQGNAAWLYDRNLLRWTAAWKCAPLKTVSNDSPTGFTPYLNHSDRRFGLLNTPTPMGEAIYTTNLGSDWSTATGAWIETTTGTAPLSRENGRHLALLKRGARTAIKTQFSDASGEPSTTVIEHPWATVSDSRTLLSRHIRTSGALANRLRLLPANSLQGEGVRQESFDKNGNAITCFEVPGPNGTVWLSVLIPPTSQQTLKLSTESGTPVLSFTGDSGDSAIIGLSSDPGWTLDDLAGTTHVFSARGAISEDWFSDQFSTDDTELVDVTLETRGEVAEPTAAYVLDTMTIPYDNPYQALFFCSGIDFVPRSTVSGWASGDGPDVGLLTTVHGDVWLVDGIDDGLKQLRWKRFATGLYQPLGIKIVDGRIYVLERGQLTILEDSNKDGTADRQLCFCGDWHVGGGEHSYHTSLENDLAGNFYFHAGGDTNTPTGGTLVRVMQDGSRSEVFCTGFRHPIGLGALPDGRISGADQEGNWMPSTRIDLYRQGGFYGDMRAHHREVAPETYDGPLCWLPRQLDGSAGGQIFVNRDDFGPLGGHLLHMSFGTCRLMALLIQEHAGVDQAGAFDLGLQCLSGIQRGRFRNSDGHLYLTGMDGWQTAAVVDGCLQRVRYTGKEFAMPTAMTLENGGIKLQFSQPITRNFDPASSPDPIPSDPRRYHVELWNYRWSQDYGSRRYQVSQPGVEGQDPVAVTSATVIDPWTVFLKVPGLRPAMQAQIEYDLIAYHTQDDGQERLKGAIYSTIHTTGPAIEVNDGDRLALIGGTLIEREQRYGYWEHAITAAYPDRKFTLRNLGWSADTVWADSRGIFDAPAKGYARMLEQVQELQPTLFVMNYGANEAWESLQSREPTEAAVARFIAQYGKLIDELTVASRGKPVEGAATDPDSTPPRFVLLTPLPMEAGVGPNTDPSAYNNHLAHFTAAIQQLARDRGFPCINLSGIHPWYQQQPVTADAPREPLTDNGLHLSEYGYWRTADWIREQLCAEATSPALVLTTETDASALLGKFEPVSQRIVIETDRTAAKPASVLKFRAQLSSLPLPALDHRVATNSPRQNYLIRTPGTYRMELDGELAATGSAADWGEGITFTSGPDATRSREMLTSIRRKNELYFHRWRPQNITYLFLFRAHEQGNNAVEIPQFDPLVAKEEARIDQLKAPQQRVYELFYEPASTP